VFVRHVQSHKRPHHHDEEWVHAPLVALPIINQQSSVLVCLDTSSNVYAFFSTSDTSSAVIIQYIFKCYSLEKSPKGGKEGKGGSLPSTQKKMATLLLFLLEGDDECPFLLGLLLVVGNDGREHENNHETFSSMTETIAETAVCKSTYGLYCRYQVLVVHTKSCMSTTKTTYDI